MGILILLTLAQERGAIDLFKQRVAAAWTPLTDGVLEVLPFDGGLELRARGTNKQHAVKAVLSPPYPWWTTVRRSARLP